MPGAIYPLPNAPSWRGAQFKKMLTEYDKTQRPPPPHKFWPNSPIFNKPGTPLTATEHRKFRHASRVITNFVI
jgi:hypothetical protein